jgi:putative colanic acid biosynthesis acetyltransferase WcaF
MAANMPEQRTFQDLSQFQLPAEFRGKPAWFVQLWWLVQAIFFRPSPQAFYAWRRFLLRCFGAQIGKQVLIRPTAAFTYPWKVTIGDYSWIGDEVVVYSLSQVHIGSHTVISQRSYLCAATHDYTRPTFDMVAGPIHIADQVWIAADVFVAPGVSIEQGCLVGARSSVFQDLPAGMICYGNPAKAVKPRLPVKAG